jgi:hypothetical protein
MGVITDATDTEPYDNGTRWRPAASTDPDTVTAQRIATVMDSRPRHPARVTWDRLTEHMEKYSDQLTPREFAAIEVTCRALQAIADGAR